MMRFLAAIVARDVSLAYRAGGGAAQTVLFFALSNLLFALALGPERALLSQVAAPILWTTALLSSLLSLDRLFQADFEDGSLDLLIGGRALLAGVVLAKALAHWLYACAPAIAAAPLLAVTLGLDGADYTPLVVALLVGSPALSLVGAIGAALTFPLRRATALTALVVGPLFAPTVIFGVEAARSDATIAPILFLGGYSLFMVTIAPIAAAAAIRANA